MVTYGTTKAGFLASAANGSLAQEIGACVREKLGKHTSRSEFRSWENSMQEMAAVLSDPEIPGNAGIAAEYNIPQTSKRADIIATGYDAQHRPCAVIIELKQWESIHETKESDALVETFLNGGMHKVVHPSYQAWSYAAFIRDYNQSVQEENIRIIPCAYLHNYPEGVHDPIRAEQYRTYIDEAPVFTRGHADSLRRFIRRFIVTGDDMEILRRIDSGKIRPSKSLQDSVAGMLKGNREFIMIDEQKAVYETVIRLAEESLATGRKHTVVISGGPGTGKSVVAVNLLAELTGRGQFVQYVSKNAAPRTVYRKRLKGTVKKSSVDNLFKGSGIYTEAGKNTVHTILADEAHRLNARSTIFQNKGENQIKEIIRAAYCSVFFIDENQRVTTSDIGAIGAITRWAREEGSMLVRLELASQFRCGGSEGYPAWVDSVLEIGNAPAPEIICTGYDLRVFDDPGEMHRLIEEKNTVNHRSRILAGYCWDWNKKEENNPNFHDIQIGDFSMSWNLANSVFALDDSSIHEAGFIHTTQGLEFDYVGVIIGDDLRYANGHILTDPAKRAKTDHSLRGIRKLYAQDPERAFALADSIIKNTYHTLLTRGMRGCYIYCTDEKLREYLRQNLPKTE